MVRIIKGEIIRDFSPSSYPPSHPLPPSPSLPPTPSPHNSHSSSSSSSLPVPHNSPLPSNSCSPCVPPNPFSKNSIIIKANNDYYHHFRSSHTNHPSSSSSSNNNIFSLPDIYIYEIGIKPPVYLFSSLLIYYFGCQILFPLILSFFYYRWTVTKQYINPPIHSFSSSSSIPRYLSSSHHYSSKPTSSIHSLSDPPLLAF